ncbi:MAG: cytochrome c [Pseudorhodoplanes sp.]|nr:cytochrome c [Pseudorhodoplanes sp.]
MRRSALVVTAALLVPSLAGAEESVRVREGRRLAAEFCSPCHAVGKTDASAHPAAPAFRLLEQRVDLDDVRRRLRGGLFAGHADMPQFKMTREQARAMHAYLRSIQGP